MTEVVPRGGLAWVHPDGISRTRNVAWNGASRLVQVGLQFAAVPLHLHLLGASAYGLVVLSATIMAALSFFEQFVNAIVLRELGRGNASEGGARAMWSVILGLEKLTWGFALLVGVCAALFGPLLTRHWSHELAAGASTLTLAFALLGAMAAGQLAGALYASGLLGLQRQKLLAAIRIVWTIVYYGVGVLLLALVERHVLVLLAWQGLAFAVLAALLRGVLLRVMPLRPEPLPDQVARAVGVWKLGLSALALGVTGSAVGQIDKLIVAAGSTPAAFAAYGLAFTIVLQVVGGFSVPLGTAMIPHFAHLAEAGDRARLQAVYHRMAQAVMLIGVPTLGLLFLWFTPLIALWLGRQSPLTAEVNALLPVVILSAIVGSAAVPSFMMAIAAGRADLIIVVNVVSLLLAVAVLPGALERLGTSAGAWYWVAVNLGYCLVCAPLVHRLILGGAFVRWLALDALLPIAIGFAVFGAASAVLPAGADGADVILWGLAAATTSFVVLLAALPHGRSQCASAIAHFLATRAARSPSK